MQKPVVGSQACQVQRNAFPQVTVVGGPQVFPAQSGMWMECQAVDQQVFQARTETHRVCQVADQLEYLVQNASRLVLQVAAQQVSDNHRPQVSQVLLRHQVSAPSLVVAHLVYREPE